ncbi:MAG: thioether cross-link-forming SCIFF peptide maturase [Clostridiales bacterium]|nr:thioether cross-link-forming SCIFF peptide maturase [Clostridiales bacterium]
MIHKFKIEDVRLVLDVNSGAVHIIDELFWDLLDYGPQFFMGKIVEDLRGKYKAEELEEGVIELKKLIEEEMLYTSWDEEDKPSMTGEPVIKAMCLHAAHDCNLRCSYCFASTGDFKGKRSILDLETGKKALDFLIQHSGNRRNLEVDFFGGEPLMNFPVVRELVEYGRKQEKKYNKKFRFTITTNGLLLNEDILEYINKEFVNVVVSIDGRPEVHDRLRKTCAGTGSYNVIMPRAVKLAESRNQTDYYVRGTFTKFNKDFDKDVLHLADAGFKQISVEPVVASEEEEYHLSKEDLQEIYDAYDRLLKVYLERKKQGRGFNFFHFQVDMEQGPCAAKRSTGCGAGNEYIAVTPEGDIYPCHQFVGNEDFKMGSVLDGSFDTEMQKVFRSTNVFTKEKCASCWAKFYCSGGCAANAQNFSGDIRIPYELGCDMEKKRLECALAIKALEYLEEEAMNQRV